MAEDLLHLEATASIETLAEHFRRLGHIASVDRLTHHLVGALGRLIEGERLSVRRIVLEASALPERLRPYAQEGSPLSEARGVELHTIKRIAQWTAAIVEMTARLQADWPEIQQTFALDKSLRLVAISPPLGDLHQNGRAVHGLRYSDGRAVIYKPRSVDQEHAFNRLMTWLRCEHCPLDLSATKVVPRGGYGWTEFVSTRPAQAGEEAIRFYRRQGAFLAVFWLLSAGDLLDENVVVSGEHPIWVDTENTGVPETVSTLDGKGAVPAWISDSMLTTGMVYSGKSKQFSLKQQTALNLACTEDRSVVFTRDDVIKSPYRGAVIEGFRAMYTWLIDCPTARSFDTGPLTWFHGLYVRVIPRSTAFYARLKALLSSLSDEGRLAITSDLTQALREELPTGGGSRRLPDEVIRLEVEALQRGDIPYWHTTTDSYVLRESDNTASVTSLITMTGMDNMKRRARRMCHEDGVRQAWLLDAYL